MNVKRVITILLITLCLGSYNLRIEGAELKKHPQKIPQLKNPITAGLYSAIIPGLGQIINKRPRGILILFVEGGLFTVYEFQNHQLKEDYNEYLEGNGYYYGEANRRYKWMQFLTVPIIGIWALNIFDAIWEVKTQNKNLMLQYKVGFHNIKLSPYTYAYGDKENRKIIYGFTIKF